MTEPFSPGTVNLDWLDRTGERQDGEGYADAG